MDTQSFLDHLVAVTNAHDVDAITACFAEDYRLEAPCHPSRDFVGREQVHRNWTMILGGVPDHRAVVLDHATVGDTVWSEWAMTGTRRDGAAHDLRGVMVFSLRDGLAHRARFYLEPVERSETSMDAAVLDAVGGPRPASS
jgi:ketosteroid isomerase-like protein